MQDHADTKITKRALVILWSFIAVLFVGFSSSLLAQGFLDVTYVGVTSFNSITFQDSDGNTLVVKIKDINVPKINSQNDYSCESKKAKRLNGFINRQLKGIETIVLENCQFIKKEHYSCDVKYKKYFHFYNLKNEILYTRLGHIPSQTPPNWCLF